VGGIAMDKNTKESKTGKVSRKKIIAGGVLGIIGLFLGDAIGKYINVANNTAFNEEKERKYAMIIDLKLCIGCDSCTTVCKQENHTPPGVQYNIVIKEEVGSYPAVRYKYLPRLCMHCEKPPCVKVCPVGATRKIENGIVINDYQRCIGCRYCMTACPYGARYFDFGKNFHQPPNAFESTPSYEYGKKWERKEIANSVRKCHFCLHRLQRDLQPACVDSCLSKARIFGDNNNPESMVSKIINKGEVIQLKPELGTSPNTFYLED
jgi:molybdopterin-containing oxidoreductase family iron-sulfur binding subunit